MMRFKLSTIFWAVGLTAALCGIMFMAPILITAIFLSFTLAISPAAWVTGAVFACGRRQAFFIGGMLTGFVPHLVTTYYVYVLAISSAGSIDGNWFQLGITESGEVFTYRMIFALLWLMPGVFSFTGGGLAWLTHRLVVAPKRVAKPMHSEESLIRDYRILSGRFQTTIAQPPTEATETITQGS